VRDDEEDTFRLTDESVGGEMEWISFMEEEEEEEDGTIKGRMNENVELRETCLDRDP